MTNRITSPVASRPDRASRSERPGCDRLSGSAACRSSAALDTASQFPPVQLPVPALLSSGLHPLLTLSQVANLLRVSDKTIRRWMLSKRLPHVRLGRVVRFRQDELLRWIEARREV